MGSLAVAYSGTLAVRCALSVCCIAPYYVVYVVYLHTAKYAGIVLSLFSIAVMIGTMMYRRLCTIPHCIELYIVNTKM